MKFEPVEKLRRRIRLISADGGLEDAEIVCTDVSMVPPFREYARLTLTRDRKSYSAVGGDFFACLSRVRMQLEQDDLLPLVNGANRDCYPSGMARDMGFGFQVYRLQIGVPMGDLDQLVETFADDAITDTVTVEDQERFYARWQRSFGG